MTTTALPAATTDVRDIARRSITLMERWDDALAQLVIHPDFTNREASAEPRAARGRGIPAIRATYDWLHSAYAGLRWEIHDVVGERDLVVMHTTMSGEHVGPFVSYGPDARITEVFAPTGRSFAVHQTHWYRMADGQVIEHWANRDDLGQAQQLGWVPPTPAFLLRSALAKRRARRAAQG